MPVLLRLEHFGCTYHQQPRPALADVSLTVRQGEFWVLCGASGCGKTTLLRQLKPALRPHGAAEGRILFDGQPLDDLPPHQQAADIDVPQRIERQPPGAFGRRVAEAVSREAGAGLMKGDAQQRRRHQQRRLPDAVKLQLPEPRNKSVQISVPPVCPYILCILSQFFPLDKEVLSSGAIRAADEKPAARPIDFPRPVWYLR